VHLHSPTTLFVVLALLSVQRLLELRRSRANLRAIHGQGRRADTRPNWVLMVTVHTLLIAGTALEVGLTGEVAPAPLFWCALVAFACAQALRLWCIRSLGPLWNARGVVFPESPVVTSGPYRWIRHPNYLAVIVELVTLPLAAGAWVTLLVVNALNAFVLRNRIRGEDALLDALPGYREAMGHKGGLRPRRRKPVPASRSGECLDRS